MNRNLDKIQVMEAGALDREHYFQSLLEQAHTNGLLGDNDIERLQQECLALLARKTELYNGGSSSSIRVEKAQELMTSVLFTLGLWLKTYPNPDGAVAALRTASISELYQKGRKRIDTMLSSAKAIHGKLLRQLVDTPNAFYRSTIEGGINGFFRLYNADFSAYDAPITADYPVLNPLPRLAGIEWVQSYLHGLYHENLFCRCFATDDLHHLLCGYLEGYEEHAINLYEPVLLAALGCTLVGTDASHLDMTESGLARLYRLLADLPEGEIAALIQAAATELIRFFECPRGLTLYLQDSLPLIVSKISAAAREKTLDRVFVLPSFPEDKPKIFLSYGDKMPDKEYRRVLEEIEQCRSAEARTAVIRESIHSLADLGDLLLDAELTDEETMGVLQGLGLPELAALSKRYQPMSDLDAFELREQEQRLRTCLHKLIASLPPSKQEIIARASEAMQEE